MVVVMFQPSNLRRLMMELSRVMPLGKHFIEVSTSPFNRRYLTHACWPFTAVLFFFGSCSFMVVWFLVVYV